MKILKFGGSSIGTPERIKKVIRIVREEGAREKLVVVVSAFEGVTNELIQVASLAATDNKDYLQILEKLKIRHTDVIKKLISPKNRRSALLKINYFFSELSEALRGVCLTRELSRKTLDFVMSFGERLSAFIMSEAMQASHVVAEFLDTRTLIKTDDNFGNAGVDTNLSYKNLKEYFQSHKLLQIATGFIGSTKNGETTTLGRGGSDYTAALFGAALGAMVIEIWTDVSGVMSADPRIVRNAKILPKMDYEEMIEMAYFGAKVVHPATMLPAIKHKIPILIKNTFDPEAHGTLISSLTDEKLPIKGIASIDNVALLNISGTSLAGIPGSALRVFSATAKANANVILISQASSEHTICLGILENESETAKKSLEEEFAEEIKNGTVSLGIIADQSIIAVVGGGMKGIPDTAGKLFHSLGESGVNIAAIAQGSSERNISFVVASKDAQRAINVIHERFFAGDEKNIFLAGIGNVGSALLRQIDSANNRMSYNIKLCGAINRNKMTLDEAGLEISSLGKALKKGMAANFNDWVRDIKAIHAPNKIFVDCTASDEAPRKYIELAEAGFHIVTPNKKFNVSPMRNYQKLRDVLAKNGRKFLYDTNVGAGLPVVSTLQNLLASGDKVLKIEGIFSGTLNYIFSNLSDRKSFGAVVSEAKALGLAEPDPRDDLSGVDVGRKLLILAREIGLSLELADVKIENLVPKPLRAIPAAVFLGRLKKYDEHFQKLFTQANSQGKVLRYVAQIAAGKLSAELVAVKKDNPLAGVRGSDNIFVFYTKNYRRQPLIIRGPGAGAEVTAAGVLANILRTS